MSAGYTGNSIGIGHMIRRDSNRRLTACHNVGISSILATVQSTVSFHNQENHSVQVTVVYIM
ncbi:MAG TPA: hypothetical protein VFV92_10305 [Candidatus Bathyarchaeia archaeon]|nr:hypothetical protein [Candidatus Bathyarchaeia archaeon]